MKFPKQRRGERTLLSTAARHLALGQVWQAAAALREWLHVFTMFARIVNYGTARGYSADVNWLRESNIIRDDEAELLTRAYDDVETVLARRGSPATDLRKHLQAAEEILARFEAERMVDHE